MVATEPECESFFQNKINSMLVTTSWVGELKERLGIEAVSQVWGDIPAWYLWLSDAPGVYHLQLADTIIDKGCPLPQQGIFPIKCYPFSNTTVFDAFSYEEQCLCRSRFFDETHTPRFEEKEKISDSLFNVGVMEYKANPDDTMACFTLESLDTLRCVYPEEMVLDFDLIRKRRRYKEGETGRSVPGWELAYPVFDRLLCMYAFYSKTTPVRVRITRSPGFEYCHTGNHMFECVDTSDIHRLTAAVLFADPSVRDHGRETDEPAIAETEEERDPTEVLLDRTFPCGHFHESDKMACAGMGDDTPVNERWWSLADTDYKSELASTCGCH